MRQAELIPKVPPTIAEVQREAFDMGLPQEEATKFFLYYESCGWIVGKKKMKSWVAALAQWKIRWDEHRSIKKPVDVPIHIRLKAVEELLGKHEANPSSTFYNHHAKAEQLADYRKLKDKREQLLRQIAEL